MENMQNDFKEDSPSSSDSDKNKRPAETLPSSSRQRSLITGWLNSLVQMGLGESLLRIGTNLFSIIAIVIVVLLVQAFNRQAPNQFFAGSGQDSGPAPTAVVDINAIPASNIPIISGIARAAQLHTNVPSRPREDLST